MVYVYERGKKRKVWIIYAKKKHWGTFCSRRGAEMYRDMLIDEGVLSPRHLNPNRYIYPTKYGRYAIQKIVDGKCQYFGAFKDLEACREERDYLERNNWQYVENENEEE